ncbi:MAG TPA: hypothetical protein VNN17_07280, partial [Terriglobia bacterium]|nr:hypothetical protein [Terriglobia bacterium]
AAPAAAPAPAPAAPGEEPAPTAGNGRVLSSLEAATDQIVAVIPKPEDILHFYSSTKGKTQEFLNNLVGSIYAMRAIMRFSMAIVGCPVRVVAEQPGEEVAAAEINGVKVVLFPADTSQTLRMEAFDDGMVEAAIYRPGGPAVSWKAEVTRLQAPVFRDDILRVHLLPGQPVQWETVRPRPGRLEGGTVSEQNQRALPMRERGGWVLENFSGQRACIRISSRCAAPEGGRADSNPWIPPHQEKGVCG